MVRFLAICLLALSATAALAEPAVIENRALRVEITPDTGRLSVREKAGGTAWEQPAVAGATTGVTLRRGGAPARQGEPLVISAAMLADARKVDGDADCSARAWLCWDDTHLFLAADVRDDVLNFGPSSDSVWERDSLEVWVGSQQLSLALSPQGSTAYAHGAQKLDGGRIALTARAGGYGVEAALPWAWVGAGMKPRAGQTLRLAVGVNDADKGAREGQIYWPRGWSHSEQSTFAEATLADAQGAAPAAAGTHPAGRLIEKTARSVTLERAFDAGAGRSLPLRLRFSLPGEGPDLRVEATTSDPNAPMGAIRFLDPFVLDAPRGVLAVADYGNGHLYPLDLQPFPRGGFGGDRLDMPWVGMVDMDAGRGYLLLLETSDDSSVSMQKVSGQGGRALVAPVVTWQPQKGAFGYARRVLYHFAPRGGYVALCKRYRDYARQTGILVPFTEKVKKNPNLRRLFGAPDVWGNASLSFAREARAAGVEKMLIHGRPGSPADMQAIRDLGYLPSEYDNYTDILPPENGKVDSSHDVIPDAAVLHANKERMKAWLTFDKKVQYMKRCPALWTGAAKQVGDRVLGEWPFLGRFIDVTTAESLYECYDAAHPLTRAGKRECGPALIGSFRDRGLVMGGEHGIWWGVPVLDYIEGMMSGGYASWPAGHLIHPKTKDQEFPNPWGGTQGGAAGWARYEQWGIGHQWRAPLWELVFHDCIVSTWYWGDASDWLLDAAPEMTAKKDAFNILYGTIPLLWADGGGSWRKERAVFLRTYRNTCKLHEALATAELVGHEFVTPDHAVQRTRFSDGTVCVVNFGEKPARATMANKEYLLPRNGWVVHGPKVQQSLALGGGKAVTSVRAPGYAYSDRGGAGVTLRAEAPGRIRIVMEKAGTSSAAGASSAAAGTQAGGTNASPGAAGITAGTPAPTAGAQPSPTTASAAAAGTQTGAPAALAGALTIRPGDVDASWKPAGALLYALDAQGQTTDVLPLRAGASGSVALPPAAGPESFLLLWGAAARQPDLRFVDLRLSTGALTQGQPLRVTATLSNAGGQEARGAWVEFLMDGRRVHRAKVSLAAGATGTITADVDTNPFDGPRRLEVVADPEGVLPELCEQNNRTGQGVLIAADWKRWQHRKSLSVDTGPLDREDEPVVVPFSLPAGADPASVRVARIQKSGEPAGAFPTQMDGDRLCFLLSGKTPARGGAIFLVLWRDLAGATTAAGPGRMPETRVPGSYTVVAAGYEARFDNGTLISLAPRKAGVTGPGFIEGLILSSKETGWNSEPGMVEQFRVEHAGPVRTVVFVRKALKAGVVYEKRYTFYPRHFEVEIGVNKPAGGLYSRAYYLSPATYADDQGHTAAVDGHGDAEGIYGVKNPKWYAVYAADWAHSCVALSPLNHIAYWDAGGMGGIGLVAANETAGIRMAYVIHPGAADASFGAEDYRRLTTPVTAVWIKESQF